MVVIELVITGGESFRNALSLFFMQDVIGIPRAGQLYVIYFVTGLLAIPGWDFLARRYGKHRSLASAMIVVSFVSLAIFALPPESEAAFKWLFAAKGLCFGAFAYLPIAMMADVIDIDTARSRDPRTGSYFAVHGFMTKCAAYFAGLSPTAPGPHGLRRDPGRGEWRGRPPLAVRALRHCADGALFTGALSLLDLAPYGGAAPALPGTHRPPRCPSRSSRPIRLGALP